MSPSESILALDSATAPRTQLPPELLEAAPLTIDVDHHHDNTRYGGINLIVPEASSTGEIVRDLLAELGVELTPAIARGAVRRGRHRHRQVPVHEHDAEGASRSRPSCSSRASSPTRCSGGSTSRSRSSASS